MASKNYKLLLQGITKLEQIYLNFSPRAAGNYTQRQLSFAAAYTVFCHSEFESYLENWSKEITDLAETKWAAKKATLPLVHLCTFHEGRGEVSSVPAKDVWSEPIVLAINKHRAAITGNNGIKEANVCRLFAPIGYDVRNIDSILLADLSAFGKLRGDYAHQAHGNTVKSSFDPFATRTKAKSIAQSLATLDNDLLGFIKTI